jgi:serine/threonine protein kinase
LLGEFKAQNPDIDHVAVKVMQSADQSSPFSSSQFHFEVAIMSSIPEHDNVVKFIGYCEKPMSIIMKHYMTSLSDMLFESDIDVPSAMVVKIAYDVTKGLFHLHKNGILHLDVKPRK